MARRRVRSGLRSIRVAGAVVLRPRPRRERPWLEIGMEFVGVLLDLLGSLH